MSNFICILQRIPEKFVRIFGDELSNEVTLTVPNGRVWQVGLTKEERKIWFHDGWHEFVQYHSISTGYFLVFKYGKKSTFNVLIFDLTACEIEYPYVKEEPEIVNEDSVKIMDFTTTPNPTFHTPKNKVFDKCSRSSSTMPTQLKRARTSFGSAFRSSKFKRSYEPQNKRSKMEEVVGSNQSNAYKVGTHSSDEATEFDEDEFMALLEDMGICVNKRFGNISAEKRERAIAAARLFKPKNPSFMVISRPIDICLRRLKIPEKFVRIFGDELSAAVVTLTVPNGQVFRVNLTKDGTKFWFDHGWHDFIQYHSIGVGYFLVFKYRKNSSFNVLIFDTTACEIKYPYNDNDVKKKNEKQNSLHKVEMENADSVPPLKSFENKVFDHFPRSSSKVQPQTSQQNPAKPSWAAEFKHGNDKRCKMEELEEKDHKSTHSSDKAKTRTKFDEDEILVLLADMGICVNKQFGNISTEEKERAIAAARLFKPKNPSFMIILRSADIHNRRIQRQRPAAVEEKPRRCGGQRSAPRNPSPSSITEHLTRVHSLSALVVMSGILALPEGCIAAVISFTSPRDACHLACVSTTFRSAADSDVVWDCFLPPEYSSSSYSSSSTTTWSALSKKELYFRTCHNLIHKSRMSFWFDLQSGKKCYMISPRELDIVDGDNIYDWCWFSIPDADSKRRFGIPTNCRFVVKRRDVSPFEIGGKITTSLLSPMTTYIAYLVFAKNTICWVDDDPAEVYVGLSGSDNGQNRTVYIHREQQDGEDDGFYPKKRADGWLETELGEFFNGGDEEGELLVTIKSEMKEGFLTQGIEIRPEKE
ncbi:hypothetical protein LWI29_015502 [Acer saccharum]|uniref:TF-B3 domain-containing protein n=1 Tax=Acer saccharum TaxID=4024 RepID=A0AA39RWI4_ACESA|nr:hypothetical protein LWI29_015502 [Acer saccharum]